MTQLQEKQIAQKKLAQTAAAERGVDRSTGHPSTSLPGKLSESDFISRPKFPTRLSTQPLPEGVSERVNREIRGQEASASPARAERSTESEPEAQKVDANDASAVRAARGETIRQVAQELMGVGRGFREAPLVLTTGAENNSAIDPVTKLPFDVRRAAQGSNREGSARTTSKERPAAEKERRSQSREGNVRQSQEREREQNNTATVLQREGASQSDRDHSKPGGSQRPLPFDQALASLQQPFRDRSSDIILSRTLLSGSREPTLGLASDSHAKRPQSPREGVQPDAVALRDTLLRDHHLYIASVALGLDGRSRVMLGDERALFHAQSLQPNPDSAKTELAREVDRERARIELQLQQQRAAIERNRPLSQDAEPIRKVDSFVTRGRWGERFERASVEGAATEVPRSAQLLREMQRRRRNRLNLIFAGFFLGVVVWVLLSNDTAELPPDELQGASSTAENEAAPVQP